MHVIVNHPSCVLAHSHADTKHTPITATAVENNGQLARLSSLQVGSLHPGDFRAWEAVLGPLRCCPSHRGAGSRDCYTCRVTLRTTRRAAHAQHLMVGVRKCRSTRALRASSPVSPPCTVLTPGASLRTLHTQWSSAPASWDTSSHS